MGEKEPAPGPRRGQRKRQQKSLSQKRRSNPLAGGMPLRITGQRAYHHANAITPMKATSRIVPAKPGLVIPLKTS